MMLKRSRHFLPYRNKFLFIWLLLVAALGPLSAAQAKIHWLRLPFFKNCKAQLKGTHATVAPQEQKAPLQDTLFVLKASGYVSQETGAVGFWITQADGVSSILENIRLDLTIGAFRVPKTLPFPYSAWNHDLEIKVIKTAGGHYVAHVSHKVSVPEDRQIIGRLVPALGESLIFDGPNFQVRHEGERLSLVFGLDVQGNVLSLDDLRSIASQIDPILLAP